MGISSFAFQVQSTTSHFKRMISVCLVPEIRLWKLPRSHFEI